MDKDKSILRALAEEKMSYAQEFVNNENAALWRDINDLKTERPALFINELPWHELESSGELTLRCDDVFNRGIEAELRRELFSRKYFPGNMVVSPFMECRAAFTDTDTGIGEDVDIVRTDAAPGSVVSRHFHIQIKGEEDIEKIKLPTVQYDEERTQGRLERYHELFDGVIPIRLTGVRGLWFTPWDNLIRLTGVQEALMDLLISPEYIDKLVARFVDSWMVKFERYTALGLWGSNNNNTRVGSGGYGYASCLPPATPENDIGCSPKHIWGCGNAQIFSSVSPEMHWEFSLKHELRWLRNFGLNYYGCCEPLHLKTGILERIPNLRKVSMSPWADLNAVHDWAQGRYVLSCKPNPTIFSGSNWNEDRLRNELRDIFNKTKGVSFELIMKDVSTVSYKPERLVRFNEIAMEEISKRYD